MNLIKELLSLNEAEEQSEVEALMAMKQSPEKNLKAVDLVLRADGDIPVDAKSRNQADNMGTQDGSQMFYVSLNPPHGDVEAYVVVDKNGKISYYDFTDEVVVINGRFASRDPVSSAFRDEMEELSDEYRLEGGKVEPGGIKAFMDLLHKSKDSDFDDEDPADNRRNGKPGDNYGY